MTRLIAYIPVLNALYRDWLKRHSGLPLSLISQELACQLDPRLSRNMVALSTEEVRQCIWINNLADVDIITEPQAGSFSGSYILPDEELTRYFVSRFLEHCDVTLEPVWGRWDMNMVRRQEPVIPDCEVDMSQSVIFIMAQLEELARRSPDWWRQTIAAAFRGHEMIGVAWNKHYPTDYETHIFGDPRINFNAGDPAGADVYLSEHAERGLIDRAARAGTCLQGASLFVNEFPCGGCARSIVLAGFKEVLFLRGYSVLKGFDTLKAHDVRIIQIKDPVSA